MATEETDNVNQNDMIEVQIKVRLSRSDWERFEKLGLKENVKEHYFSDCIKDGISNLYDDEKILAWYVSHGAEDQESSAAISQIQTINTKELEALGFNSKQVEVIEKVCKLLQLDMKALYFMSIQSYVHTVLENPEAFIGNFNLMSKIISGRDNDKDSE